MSDKLRKDIVTPTKRTYPKPKKPRKTYRTGWINGQGREVNIVPAEGKGRQRKGLTEYNAGFKYHPDPMVCIMLDVLCSEWDCSRQECMRRLMNPYVPVVRAALENKESSFQISKTFSLRPHDWPSWVKR
jgi:hypothetical protein